MRLAKSSRSISLIKALGYSVVKKSISHPLICQFPNFVGTWVNIVQVGAWTKQMLAQHVSKIPSSSRSPWFQVFKKATLTPDCLNLISSSASCSLENLGTVSVSDPQSSYLWKGIIMWSVSLCCCEDHSRSKCCESNLHTGHGLLILADTMIN